MADLDHKPFDIDELFKIDFTKDLPVNNRLTVRYIRKDIKVALSRIGFFNFRRPVTARLHDISSRGALISTQKKLNRKGIFKLYLLFKDHQRFDIKVKIIRQMHSDRHYYGIKFDRFNHKLGDHLVKTQEDLIFR